MERVEVTERSQPTGTPEDRIVPGQGVIVAGSLDGLGWYDGAVPEVLTGEACGSEGTRALVAGDYLGDVDAVLIDLAEPGRLCLRAEVGDADQGIDLVAFKLDACGIPVEPLGGEVPLGLGTAGPLVDWFLEVDAGSIAVLLAAYAPNDDDRSLPYRLGVSLMPVDKLCPLLPAEEGS